MLRAIGTSSMLQGSPIRSSLFRCPESIPPVMPTSAATSCLRLSSSWGSCRCGLVGTFAWSTMLRAHKNWTTAVPYRPPHGLPQLASSCCGSVSHPGGQRVPYTRFKGPSPACFSMSFLHVFLPLALSAVHWEPSATMLDFSTREARKAFTFF